MHGDGYTSTVMCENYEDGFGFEPDAGPIYCNYLTWEEERRYIAAYPYAVLQVEDPFTDENEFKPISKNEFDRQMARPDSTWEYYGRSAWYCDDFSEALQSGRHQASCSTASSTKPLTYEKEGGKVTVNTVRDEGTWKTTLTVGDTIAIYPHHYWVEARLFFFALKNADYVEDVIAFADVLHNTSD